MKYYTIDDVTQLLTQFDITHSKQMVNRWVRDSIIIAEKIDRKYMISEGNLISFIEQKKPKMIQLIEQTIEISERMEHLFGKLTEIEEKILELNAYQEGLNEIKQLLSTIQENTNKNNNSRKPPVKKVKVEKNQFTIDDYIENSSVNEAEGVLQGDKEDLRVEVKNEIDEPVQEHKESNSYQINELDNDNEEILEGGQENNLVEVKNDMDEQVQEDIENYPFNELENNNDQKTSQTDQTNEHFPFTDDQIKMAMGKVIDARIFSQHEKDIFNKIKTTLLDKIDEWFLPSENQCYKCLYKKKQFASAIPFLKSTAMHISNEWKKC